MSCMHDLHVLYDLYYLHNLHDLHDLHELQDLHFKTCRADRPIDLQIKLSTRQRGTLGMTMTPLTTIKIGTPIPFGDCQETVNLAHIINMTGYLVQLLEQPNLNFNLTQHQFKLYVSTLWFGQPHQPQLNNTGLLGPILIKYTQPKQQFQYNSNTNTIPIKITNIFK
jgi:hypothetical protein